MDCSGCAKCYYSCGVAINIGVQAILPSFSRYGTFLGDMVLVQRWRTKDGSQTRASRLFTALAVWRKLLGVPWGIDKSSQIARYSPVLYRWLPFFIVLTSFGLRRHSRVGSDARPRSSGRYVEVSKYIPQSAPCCYWDDPRKTPSWWVFY